MRLERFAWNVHHALPYWPGARPVATAKVTVNLPRFGAILGRIGLVPISGGYRIKTFDISKYRTFDISYRTGFALHVSRHPEFSFKAESGRQLRRVEYRNRVGSMLRLPASHRTRFRYRCAIVSKSIPISLSNRIEIDSNVTVQSYRARFRYRYKIVSHSIPMPISDRFRYRQGAL